MLQYSASEALEAKESPLFFFSFVIPNSFNLENFMPLVFLPHVILGVFVQNSRKSIQRKAFRFSFQRLKNGEYKKQLHGSVCFHACRVWSNAKKANVSCQKEQSWLLRGLLLATSRKMLRWSRVRERERGEKAPFSLLTWDTFAILFEGTACTAGAGTSFCGLLYRNQNG